MASTEERLKRRERELRLALEEFGPRPKCDALAARERDRLVAQLNAVCKLLVGSKQGRFEFNGNRG